MDCTSICTRDADCFALHYDEASGVCEMGKLKDRFDFNQGSGIKVKVVMEHMPPKGEVKGSKKVKLKLFCNLCCSNKNCTVQVVIFGPESLQI